MAKCLAASTSLSKGCLLLSAFMSAITRSGETSDLCGKPNWDKRHRIRLTARSVKAMAYEKRTAIRPAAERGGSKPMLVTTPTAIMETAVSVFAARAPMFSPRSISIR